MTGKRLWHWTALTLDKGCYWIVDDPEIPNKGGRSLRAARQYGGQLSKQNSCQVVLSLPLASGQGSLPIARRLNLSEEWARDKAPWEKSGVPTEVTFTAKPRVALEQIRAAKTIGVCVGVVPAHAGHGDGRESRDGVRAP